MERDDGQLLTDSDTSWFYKPGQTRATMTVSSLVRYSNSRINKVFKWVINKLVIVVVSYEMMIRTEFTAAYFESEKKHSNSRTIPNIDYIFLNRRHRAIRFSHRGWRFWRLNFHVKQIDKSRMPNYFFKLKIKGVKKGKTAKEGGRGNNKKKREQFIKVVYITREIWM